MDDGFINGYVAAINSMWGGMREGIERAEAREREMAVEYERSLGPNRQPPWSLAPDWANWVAMDCIGSWWWSFDEPRWDWYFGDYRFDSRRERAGVANSWDRSTVKNSIQRRPK
jgi:hypothetical protein